MSRSHGNGPLILGATGKVGRALRAAPAGCWSGTPIWQSRTSREGFLHWDILNELAPQVAPSGIVMLAGHVDSDADELVALAGRAAALARACGVKALIASSQAVYGPQDGSLREDTPCRPIGSYGTNKRAMEDAMAGQAHVTCLRIGNVMGADMLGRAALAGTVTLDRLANGKAPARSYMGPITMARVLNQLVQSDAELPPILNFAQEGLVNMDDILLAAKIAWSWRPAPNTVLPRLSLDVGLLSSLVDMPRATASALVAEARETGWAI